MNDDEKDPPSKRQARRIANAWQISKTSPTSEDMAFLAREFILCTLPHRNPGDVPGWSRKNGNLILGIQPGFDHKTGRIYGYPYGTIPRLLLAWITTEALRTKSRRLELGGSLTGFMAALGLNSANGTGKRSDARRLREQMERLFNAVISFQTDIEQTGRTGQLRTNMSVTSASMLWWSEKDPNQSVLWGSWIQLGEDFYRAITAEPVPMDVRVLNHIKQSPLAIDLYAILNRESFRASKGGKPRFLAWEWLHAQIGNEYGAVHDFRRKALPQIAAILDVHPGLIVVQQRACKGRKSGLIVSNLSTPSIPPKPGISQGKSEVMRDEMVPPFETHDP